MIETNQLILYQTEDDKTRLEVRLQDESVWLTQAQMAALFDTTVPNINIHIKNIYDENELSDEATIKDYLIVQKEGNREVSRKIVHYNLPMIIAVGYRVKSLHGLFARGPGNSSVFSHCSKHGKACQPAIIIPTGSLVSMARAIGFGF
jgi:hypothetical protein